MTKLLFSCFPYFTTRCNDRLTAFWQDHLSLYWNSLRMRILIELCVLYNQITVDSLNSHTPNNHTYPNSHFFFGLTKMWHVKYADFSVRWFKIQIFSSTESRTLFFVVGIIFSVYENLVNYESSFLSVNIFRIINKNRILIIESIPLMRNLLGYPKSHIVPKKSPLFLVSQKCDYLETQQYIVSSSKILKDKILKNFVRKSRETLR